MRSATRETFFESGSFLGAREPATFALRCGSKKPGPRMQPPEIRDNVDRNTGFKPATFALARRRPAIAPRVARGVHQEDAMRGVPRSSPSSAIRAQEVLAY